MKKGPVYNTWNFVLFVLLIATVVLELLKGDLTSIVFASTIFVLFLFSIRFKVAWILIALIWLVRGVMEANVVATILSVIILFCNTVGYFIPKPDTEESDTAEGN